MMILVRDLLKTLDAIVQGRLLKENEDPEHTHNPHVVWKSSGIPGKEIREHPGLVCGSYSKEVKRVAVTLSLTESHIEHCGYSGTDVIVVHHPVADAASAGGIPLKSYLDFYQMSLIEIHEALHGIHPGRTTFYGLESLGYHRSYLTKGVNFHVARSIVPDCTLGELVDSISRKTGLDIYKKMSAADRSSSGWPITEIVDALPAILNGDRKSKVENVLVVFPQSGFTSYHLDQAVKEFGEIDTIFQPTAPIDGNHDLVRKARELGLNYVIGACHSFETFENGLPLARSIKRVHPELEVDLLQQRTFSVPVERAGNREMLSYADAISRDYLLKRQPGTTS